MWQDNFIDAIQDSAIAPPQEVTAYDGTADIKRFNVYRNNIYVSLTETLTVGFPLCCKLVGDEFFQALARTYCAQHPPSSPVMLWYGAGFADFLSGFPPAQQVPYLSDIAHLEYAERQTTHAADDPFLDHVHLDAEKLLDMTVQFHPSVRWLASDYPLYDIWYRTRHDDHHPIGVTAQDVMLYRPKSVPIIAKLPIGGRVFLDALAQNQTITDATEAAFIHNPTAQPHLLLPLALETAVSLHPLS